MANIENLQSIDNLLEAIDVIASSRSSANAPEEQIIIATIIENDQANQGRYKIEDGLGQRYYAQSDNYDYQINDAVYAMTPISSAEQDKIILGKYRTEEQQQYGTVSIETKQDFLTMETLAAQTETTAGAGIISTWPQPPTADSKIVVELFNFKRDTNTLEDVDKILKQLNTYDRLLLDVNITTALKATKPTIAEEYNFILTFVSKNAINDEGVQSIITNTFTFGSKDIFGNPFALSTSDQSAVFNLEDLGEISSMKLEVEVTSPDILTVHSISLHAGYSITQIQKPGIIISTPELLTFTANDNEEVRQRDLIAHIFWPTTNNNTSRLQDLTEIPELYSFKVLKYDASSMQSDPIAGEHWVEEANLTMADLTTNQSESSLSMVPYVMYQSSALPIELPAVSYQAMLVYNTNTDATVSAIDTFLTINNDIVNALFPSPRPSSWEMDDRIFYSATELLQYLLTEKYLLSSELTEQDQIILWGESDEDKANNFAALWDLWQTQYPIFRSNVITFTQTNFDPLLTIKSSVDNIFINVDTGYSGGVFNNYYSNNVLINSREKNIQRPMTLSYRTFKGDYYSFDDYDTIAWYFPLDNTMIHEPEKDFEYQLATLSSNEFYADRYKDVKVNYATNIENDNKWIFEQIPNMPTGRYGKITRFAIEDNSLGGDELHCYRTCSQTFRINEIYNPQYVNNSIYCVIQQRGIISAVREIPLTFNSTGGQGLDVTFRLELHKSDVTMAHDQNSNTDRIQSYSIYSSFATYFAAQHQKHSVAVVPKIINEEHEVLTPQQITEHHTLTYYVYYCKDSTNDLWDWKELDFSNTNLLSIYSGYLKTYFYLTEQQELIIIRNEVSFIDTATKYFKYFTVKCIVSEWETPVKYLRDNQGFINLPSVTETTLQREIKKVDLINYCPIPCAIAHASSTNKFICTGIQGSNVVKYSSFNTVYPEYEKINYSLLNAIDTIDVLKNQGQYYFYLQKSNNRASSYELTDLITFDSVLSEVDNFNIYSLQIRKRTSSSENAYFTFPILVYNDAYENIAFNNWDGKLTIDPTNNSYILASMLGAGTKDSENKFTGVAMGELSSNSLIGLYGFKEGIPTFGFKTDGTAFIGKENGSGSIIFDGTKSIIQSNNYTLSTGTLINLQDGYVSLGGKLKIDGKKSILHSSNWNGNIQYNSSGDVIQFTPGTSGSILELQTGLFSFGGGNLTFFKNESTHENELIVQGTIKAGYIGGWVIDEHRLYSKVENAASYTGINQVGYGSAFYAKANDYTGTEAVFRVDHDGTLYTSQGKIGNFTISEDGLSCVKPISYQTVDRAFGTPVEQNYYESIKNVGYKKTTDTSRQSGKTYYRFNSNFIAITLFSDDIPAELDLWYRPDPTVQSYVRAQDEAIISNRQYYQKQLYAGIYTGNTPQQDGAYEQIPASTTEGYRLTQDPGILQNKTYYIIQPQIELYYNSSEAIFTYDAVLKILQTGSSSYSIFQVSPKGAVVAMKGRYEAASLIVTNQYALTSNSIIATNASSTQGTAAKFRAIAIAASNGRQYSGVVQMSGAGNFGLYSDTHSHWILYFHREGGTLTLGDPKNGRAAIDFYYADTSLACMYPHVNKSIDLGYSTYRWNNIYGNTLYNSSGMVTSSDKKVKNHIQYLNNNDLLEQFMMDLKPAMYTLSYGTGHRHHMGLYAQDVSITAHNTIGDIAAYKASVNSPNTDETYYNPEIDDQFLEWGLDYNELLAPTIALLQKTTIRVKKLEQEIEQLKQQIN